MRCLEVEAVAWASWPAAVHGLPGPVGWLWMRGMAKGMAENGGAW